MAIKHSLENYRPVDCPRDYDHLVPHAASIQHPAKDIAIRISYQSHVYSRGAKNSDPSYDFLDEGDNKRVFCEDTIVKKSFRGDMTMLLSHCGSTPRNLFET